MAVDTINHVDGRMDVLQEGDIKVAGQIIRDLSSGVYSTPAVALKEIVNNSYDACASLVTIRMLPHLDTIQIHDNGEGMNWKDFDENFTWISKSNKRNQGEISQCGRPLIGKIGIGFIAVNEICDKMEVISSKKGEPIKFTATIDFVSINEESDISKIESSDKENESKKGALRGKYKLINEYENKDEHYTTINLIGIKDTAKAILNNQLYKSNLSRPAEDKRRKERRGRYKYFNSMKDLLEIHSKRDLHGFSEDDYYLQFAIELASYIPVEYLEGGPIEGVTDEVLQEIVEEQRKLNFKVDLDGIYLKKPIYFARDPEILFKVKSFRETIPVKNGPALKFKGYFYCQNTTIFPRELNGISIKLKNVPIAKRFGFDSTFLDYPYYTDQIFRNWVSGEIYVESGLEEAMNIDRQSFRETQESYIKIQDFLHKYLRETVFGEMAMSLYNQGKKNRERVKAEQEEQTVKKLWKGAEIEEVIDLPPNIPYYIPIDVKESENKTKIIVSRNRAEIYNKSEWLRLRPVLLIFERALQESNGDIDKMRDTFYKEIADYFRKQRKSR